MRLEVRCCCQPQKLLGWIDVDPRAVRRGAVIHFTIPPPAPWPWSVEGNNNAPTMPLLSDVALPIDTLGTCVDGQHVTRLALKSEETPLEVLRCIPGFMENQHGY
jgi:hypothetical protein